MSGRKRGFRTRFVSTSVHLPYEYLDRIEELGEKPSPFIRSAVGEKLEREEGFLAAITRAKDDLERLEMETARTEGNIAVLEERHISWMAEKERLKARDEIMTEFLTGSYLSESKLLTVMKKQMAGKKGLEALVHEVWVDIMGDEEK